MSYAGRALSRCVGPKRRRYGESRILGIKAAAALTRSRSCRKPRGKQPVNRRAVAPAQISQDSIMDTNGVDGGHLRAFIERIEKLEEEKKAIADDIKDVYAEAKGTGFDAKVIRKVVSLRRQDKQKRQEEEEILGLYLAALGME
jgi:uncharacterized protein (UPF0335 family)